jgi:hypothetical protein
LKHVGTTLLDGHLALVNPVKNSFSNNVLNLSEQSSRLGLHSTFFFMAANRSDFDTGYDPDCSWFKPVLAALRQSGATIGLHASYASHLDIPELITEKQCLEAAMGQPIHSARQHYLRFMVPNTWRSLDLAGFRLDSTLGYVEHEGFRSGTCHPFETFDLKENRSLKLVELPLIVMDGTLHGYRKLTPSAGLKIIELMSSRCKSVEGTFTLLWHNTSLANQWEHWVPVYLNSLLLLSTMI